MKPFGSQNLSCHAPRERVSWNIDVALFAVEKTVTLHVSVWVEMDDCGVPIIELSVTLHVSVWVEITEKTWMWCVRGSRSTWACELKCIYKSCIVIGVSHAPRERVSWNWIVYHYARKQIGHAPRERVSWNCRISLFKAVSYKSHAPRERVSWNNFQLPFKLRNAVTLHVSVWVEISCHKNKETSFTSRSTWACELKFFKSSK